MPQNIKTMKGFRFLIGGVAVILALTFSYSCNDWLGERQPGSISLSFTDDFLALTKAAESVPDTNDFILRVADSKGRTLYDGRYGDSPEKLLAEPGSYNVSIRSRDFSAPAFSTPQYGDDQVVVVLSGEESCVRLTCTQVNAGIRLKVASEFLTNYPDGTLHLKSADGGLMYSYSETRIAYFNPGAVSLVLSRGAKDETLFSRNLEPRQILTLNISAPAAGGSLSVSVDTSRNWVSENYVIGSSGSKGESPDNAMGVAEARSNVGASGVWVSGYIVGGDLTSSNAVFQPPYSSRTNILLGSRSSSSDKQTCLSVQLQKGAVRDALNLVDHPELLGSQVFLKGDIVESYYGIPGLQNITDFQLKD